MKIIKKDKLDIIEITYVSQNYNYVKEIARYAKKIFIGKLKNLLKTH